LLNKLILNIKKVYGKRLITLAIFGSWASGRQTYDSDLDILIIAEGLPRKRLARVREFEKVEKSLSTDVHELAGQGKHILFSPVFKTPEEVEFGSLLFLDMLYDCFILYDRGSFFRSYLEKFRARLNDLGAKRIHLGDKWYWILKPDYRQGETFSL
jgi:predicted nucleotidyltransferase